MPSWPTEAGTLSEMPEAYEALEEGSCPACGAKAVWNPAKQALICPYCGTEAAAELDQDTGKIKEIDLATALRDIPESQRGWQTEKISVQCRSCKAISVFEPGRVGQNCSFCGSPELVPYEEIRSPLRPQSLLPFKIDESRVRESIRNWYASKWFAPNALKRCATVDTLQGYYLPYWTFDAQVSCHWQADSGTYYYTTESYRDSKGNRQTRQVRHVRWRPVSGSLEHFFDDEPVPGSHGVHPQLLRAIEPFPTSDLVPYDTACLSGFVVEHYQVVLIDAAAEARRSMEEKLRRMCAKQIPGDTYRNLRVDADYSGETFKHILVPVWLLAYQYGKKSYQVLVNGYTGKMEGEYPKSTTKIVLVALLVLVFLAIVLMLARN